MESQPKTVSVAGGLSLVVCINEVTFFFKYIFFKVRILTFFFSSNVDYCYLQIVLVKDKKKVFTMVDHGYDATVGAIHPGGTTVAIGGEVSGHLEILDHDWEKVSGDQWIY